MKAHIKNTQQKEIVLSIGMIVKNEEKHLENCLSALKRFMDQISCELIIVDTGSTDRTKEIALKYTDKVYDFEWIDDFAAARNFGLEKAKGKWFMFLDADEYIDEDCSQMVTFFSYPELYEKYNSASYIIRNYMDKVTKESNDFLGSRLARIVPGVRFEGKIHEYLVADLPHGCFDTIFHHYGYLDNDAKFLEKRTKRNLPMLIEEYKKNPHDIRILSLLIDAYGNDDKAKTNEYLEKALKLIDLPQSELFRNGILLRALKIYSKDNKYKKVFEIVDKYFSINDNEKSVSVLHVYPIQGMTYYEISDYEKSALAYENYFKAYEKYKNHELDVLDLRFDSVAGCSKLEYDDCVLRYIQTLIKSQKFDKAEEWLKKFNISEMSLGFFKRYILNYYFILKDTKKYSQTADLYKNVLALKNDDKINLVLYMLEQYYKDYLLERENFVDALVDSGVEGLYIDLMRLVKADSEGQDISELLAEFITKPKSWKDGYSEAIYLCMKHNVDMNGLISKLSYNILRAHFPIMATAHQDYAKVVLEYCNNVDLTQNIKCMLWMVSALETAVLASQNLYAEEREELYNLFICALSDYIFNIYNPDLLTVEDADVLPELHRFGFYMTLAFTAKNDGDDIGYIRCLREALRLCEPMKDLVSFYLEQFEKELKDTKQKI